MGLIDDAFNMGLLEDNFTINNMKKKELIVYRQADKEK